MDSKFNRVFVLTPSHSISEAGGVVLFRASFAVVVVDLPQGQVNQMRVDKSQLSHLGDVVVRSDARLN